MGCHSFSLDPRTVLGVTSEASLDEIHEAFRSKSKKHHPDLGGDEWAFRMVTRAYEVLKTTSSMPSKPWEGDSQFDTRPERQPDENGEANRYGASSRELRVVDIELIWTRFESDTAARQLSSSEESEGTLSVCLVISWPAPHLVTRVAELSAAGEILHDLIDLYERHHGSSTVLAGRSRIEDGRFVGWLSYPTVLAAQDAFLSLRSTLQTHGLTVKLQTVDERVPFAWQGTSEESIRVPAS
jgi:DnaJ domain